MANVDYARGAVPISSLSGGPVPAQYVDLAATHDAIGTHDLVERRSDGFVHQAVASSRQIEGISLESKAANTGGKLAIAPAKNVIFQMQSDDATIAAQTDLGLNYNFVIGAPSNGRSIAEVDGNTGVTTATLPIRPLRISSIVSEEGNAFGANVLLDCVFNECAYNGGGTGI